MVESSNTGNDDPQIKTTTKLSADSTAKNIVQTDSNGNTNTSGQAQPQAPQTVDSLQLTVIEGFQVGRGVARIDPNDIARLACQPGDIVMITGGRTTAAKVVPSALVDRGQQTIQMDSQVRQNSASGLGERITLRKAKVRNAEKVTLLPLSGGAPIQESDLQYIARYLVGLPVTIGDLLRVGTPGAAPREFLIIGTTPATPSYTIRKRNTGDLNAVMPPVQPEPITDVEAVLVQPGTIVRPQARGAASGGGPGRVGY